MIYSKYSSASNLTKTSLKSHLSHLNPFTSTAYSPGFLGTCQRLTQAFPSGSRTFFPLDPTTAPPIHIESRKKVVSHILFCINLLFGIYRLQIYRPKSSHHCLLLSSSISYQLHLFNIIMPEIGLGESIPPDTAHVSQDQTIECVSIMELFY